MTQRTLVTMIDRNARSNDNKLFPIAVYGEDGYENYYSDINTALEKENADMGTMDKVSNTSWVFFRKEATASTKKINLVQLLNEASKSGLTVEYNPDGEVIIIAKNGDTKAELGTIQGLIEVLQEKIK